MENSEIKNGRNGQEENNGDRTKAAKLCSAPQCHRSCEDIEIDELLETIWELRETGKVTVGHYKESSAGRTILERMDDLYAKNLLQVQSGHVKFTTEGEKRARNLVRRHRLTERMLTDLFEIPQGRIEGTSCEIEHILSEEVTDSICAFLGHPTTCPHGKPIPPGECCHKLVKTIKPLVIPLLDLDPGEKGRIVFIASKDRKRLQKLCSLGMVPGGEITLHQKLPSVVIQAGETEVALDKSLVAEIYVKRMHVRS